MLLISFSGRSPELLCLLPHIPTTVPIIALSGHMEPEVCPLLSLHGPLGMGVLLPAPIHEEEETSLGVSAPTSSTTVALCLGDALALAIARKLHTDPGRGPADVFRSHHPGGVIGAAAAAAGATPSTTPSAASDVRLLDILLTAIQHPNAKSWVFLSDSELVPPRRIRSFLSRHTDVDLRVSDAVARDSGQPLTVSRANWFLVAESTPLAQLRRLVSTSRDGPDPISVIAVVKDVTSPASCIGVMEAEDLWSG